VTDTPCGLWGRRTLRVNGMPTSLSSTPDAAGRGTPRAVRAAADQLGPSSARFALVLFGAVGSKGGVWQNPPPRPAAELYDASIRHTVPLHAVAAGHWRNIINVNGDHSTDWDVFIHCWSWELRASLTAQYAPLVVAAAFEDNRAYESAFAPEAGAFQLQGLWSQESMGLSLSRAAMLVMQHVQQARRGAHYDGVVFTRPDALVVTPIVLEGPHACIPAGKNLRSVFIDLYVRLFGDYLYIMQDPWALGLMARLPFAARARQIQFVTHKWVSYTLTKEGASVKRARIFTHVDIQLYRRLWETPAMMCRGYDFFSNYTMTRDEWQRLVDTAAANHRLNISAARRIVATELDSGWKCLDGAPVSDLLERERY